MIFHFGRKFLEIFEVFFRGFWFRIFGYGSTICVFVCVMLGCVFLTFLEQIHIVVLNQEASEKTAKRDKNDNQVINFVLDDSKFNISI